MNAIQALRKHDGERCLTIATSADAGSVKIVFQDTGPGIPFENVSKVFDPFFTTLDVGKGVGLGLSISYGIIEEHGGKISVLTRRGEGTQFVVELPLERPAPIPVTRLTALEQNRIHVKRVLVIDEEDSIRNFLTRVFQKDGSIVDTAVNWPEAVKFLEKTAYEVVISDLRIPGGDKWTAYGWLRDHRPDLVRRTIFMTGDSPGPDVQSFMRETQMAALTKPFTVDELKEKVSSVVPR